MFPSADKLYEDADFLFQQDLTPVQGPKTNTKHFGDCIITELDGPSNLVDLKMRNTQPKTTDDLKTPIKGT